MKNIMKKKLCFLVSLVLLLSVFTIFPATFASAEDHSIQLCIGVSKSESYPTQILAGSVTSSNTTVATASVENVVSTYIQIGTLVWKSYSIKVTCSGLSAGQSTVTVYDEGGSPLFTVLVTVVNHQEAVDPAVAPTTSVMGLTEGKHCSLCGKVLVAQEVVPIVGDLEYELDDSTNTAKVIGTTNKKVKKITIPNSIRTQGGKNYTVTIIADNALKDLKKLTQLTLCKNIVKIGKSAFSGCVKLETIDIVTKKLTKKSIGKNCIKNINPKATIKLPKKMHEDYEEWFTKNGKPPQSVQFK